MTLDVATEGLTYCNEDWKVGCGTCGTCGAVLTGRSRWFCAGGPCAKNWRRNHQWGVAKAAALKRDGYRCVRLGCGAGPHSNSNQRGVEVNHIAPLASVAHAQGLTTSAALRSRTGCWNHLENLETLCITHHREATAEQRAAGELG